MDSTMKPFSLIQLLLFNLFLPFVKNSSDFNTLVFKNCSTQTITHSTDDDAHSQTLSSLFQQLVPHSSHYKFFRATAGRDLENNNNGAGVSGLFQCRRDLSNDDCYNCVNSLPEISNTSCNKAAAARIQLHGCYFRYQTNELSIHQTSKFEVLHKVCGEKAEDVGFEDLRDEAFAKMENGIIGGGGFYSGSHEHVHVMAQCEEDLVGHRQCGACVSDAVQIIRQECDNTISGQIYLDRCFISYGFIPNEEPGNSYGEHGGRNSSTGKLVAIVLGGAVALGLGLIFLMFLKSCRKKDDIW
ncbi:hypothetical protein Pint_20361 [Pistacia integerrima]|uniref:Uncharacterized protein n=1 Tax=Pistacia integerrima TaxID=434235 RepID=A0ACC0XEB2_9ROSI|nr:hypothetical protein Pint_20361 [Pistacia integerrima]